MYFFTNIIMILHNVELRNEIRNSGYLWYSKHSETSHDKLSEIERHMAVTSSQCYHSTSCCFDIQTLILDLTQDALEVHFRDFCLLLTTGVFSGLILKWITILRKKEEKREIRRIDLKFILVKGSTLKIIEISGEDNSILKILKELKDA